MLSGTSLLGTTVTIRKFPRRYRHVLAEIVRTGALSWPCAKFLLAAVSARANILISGGMGTGKSTLMDVLLCDGIVSPLERIVLISETHDLSAEQVLPDCVVLQARPPNADQQGEVKQSELSERPSECGRHACASKRSGAQKPGRCSVHLPAAPGRAVHEFDSETPRQALGGHSPCTRPRPKTT